MQNLASHSSFFHKAAVISLLVLWAALAFSKALVEISFFFALGFWILWKISLKEKTVALDRQWIVVLAAFSIWTVLSVFWSEARKPSVQGIGKVLEQVMIFVMTVDLFREARELKLWEKTFLWVFAIVSLDAWIQYFTGTDLIRRRALEDSGAGMRVSACFKTYGLFASYLIMTLPVVFGLGAAARKTASKKWLLYLVLVAGGGALLFLTRSRGGMLALLAGFFTFLIYTRQFRIFFIALLLALASLAILPKHVIIHLDIERKEQSLVERWYLWDRALNVIKAKPLTGTGINTYAVAHQKYDKTENWRVKNYYAHNGYLQMGAEVGLPGLGLFLYFLGLYFFRSLRGTQNCPACMGLLVGVLNFLVLCLVDTVLHNPPAVKTFWFLMAMGLAYQRSAKTGLNPGPEPCIL